MTAKEYLSQAKDIKVRIGAMAEQLEFLKAAAEYIMPQLSDMPKPASRNVHKNEDAIIRLIEREERMKSEYNRLDEIIATINAVENPTYQAILVKRYIGEKLWCEISSELRISITRLYELHRVALAEVDAVLKVRSES